MRPELLAIRAVNQYRRRDIVAYVGLRYYLENLCARSNMWAREISTHLVSTRVSPVYFRSRHFSKVNEEDSVVYRNIHIPGPNEIIAESLLLHECSRDLAFQSLSCVFSYRFPKPNSKEGIFRNYFPGFRERHKLIGEACRELNGAVVQYTDIRRFYPNISEELALRVWRGACESSSLSPALRELGERLLADHAETATAQNDGLGVLTGPMFSHLIANLVLGEVDRIMLEEMEGRYWRYVDDMVLVGTAAQVGRARDHLNSILSKSDMGFELHDEDKDLVVDSTEWLKGADDFDDPESGLWIRLIANIKRFLVVKGEERDDLARAFAENGINLPLLDYSNAAADPSYLERLSDWLARQPWAPMSMRALTVSKLVEDALQARSVYQARLNVLLEKTPDVGGYERKRLITKLRYYSGRLIFLASFDDLSSMSSALADYPELLLQSRVMSAIQSRDVSTLLRFGVNAVQAAAQVLRIQSDSVQCFPTAFGEIELQGLAVLRLNGINVNLAEDAEAETKKDHLNQFALGHDPAGLMKSDDLFIREIACLRGIENPSRHNTMLGIAFDRDEQLILDITNRLHESSYF